MKQGNTDITALNDRPHEAMVLTPRTACTTQDKVNKYLLLSAVTSQRRVRSRKEIWSPFVCQELCLSITIMDRNRRNRTYMYLILFLMILAVTNKVY